MVRVKIITYVPTEAAERLRQAIGEAGAGTLGNYSYCSFSTKGEGRFVPNEDANPFVGENGSLHVEKEEKIEVVCDRADAKKVVEALKAAHPYEEVAFEVIALIDEEEL